MTKKELEARIAQLESKIVELQGQMLQLSLRQTAQITFTPATYPEPRVLPNPEIQHWPPYTPYIGDAPGWMTSPSTCRPTVLSSGQHLTL